MKTRVRWHVAFFAVILGTLLFTILVSKDITIRRWTISHITVLTWLAASIAAFHLVQITLLVFSTDSSSDSERSCSKKIEILVVCIAAVGGLYALNIYKETNIIAMRIALEQRDSATRDVYFEKQENGERMMLVFITDPVEKIDSEICDPASQESIRKWATNVVFSITDPNEVHNIPPWSEIRDLYASLFDGAIRTSKGINDVRRAFFHTVEYLYIVHDAYQARIGEVFTDDEYEMWAAYIEDLGSNPFFLMTVLDGHELGYITRAFSGEIWQRYSKNKRLRCVARALYPNLVQDKKSWMSSWGKLRETGLTPKPVQTNGVIQLRSAGRRAGTG